MLRIYKSGLVSLFSLCLVLLMAQSGKATELITNGGFEAGFLGWSVVDESGGSGSWFASNSTTSPLSSHTTAGAASGSFYAVTDQFGPGAHALLQSFFVPLGTTSLNLSFDMFANNWAANTFCPGPIDFTVNPNQCARVDLLTGAAGAFDTGAGDLANFYAGSDGNGTHPYTHYSFDLTGLAALGGTYQVRFDEADYQLYFNQGVDKVSITATGSSTPEPGTMLLFGSGLLSLGGVLRRRISNRQVSQFCLVVSQGAETFSAPFAFSAQVTPSRPHRMGNTSTRIPK